MLLLLNTADASNSSNYQPQFTLHNLQYATGATHARISLHSAIVPNLRYTIHAGNQTLVFQENSVATDLTATITAGDYSGASLATELKTRLDAAGANTYTVTYSAATKKITIASSATNHKIMGTSTCLYELGYVETTFATTTTSSYPVRLDGTTYIDIVASTYPVNSVASDGRRNVLARIPLSSSFGTIIYFENNDPVYSDPIELRYLRNLEFEIRDDQNNQYILPATAYVSLQINLG